MISRGRAIFTYTGNAERHHPVVAHHTQPNTMPLGLGVNYKAHGMTQHPGTPDGEQVTTLHRVLR